MLVAQLAKKRGVTDTQVPFSKWDIVFLFCLLKFVFVDNYQPCDIHSADAVSIYLVPKNNLEKINWFGLPVTIFPEDDNNNNNKKNTKARDAAASYAFSLLLIHQCKTTEYKENSSLRLKGNCH